MKKLTAIGYIWTSPSTPDAEGIARSCRETINNYCRENNISFKKMFKDLGGTGTANKREEMTELLQYIDENKIDYLIVDSLYSLGRRFHDVIIIFNEFKNRTVGLISINEKLNTLNAEGQNIINALFSIPHIAHLVRPKDNSIKSREKEIFYSGGACPYGYMIDRKTNHYQVIEQEALIIRRIFRERLSGRSLRQIANDLSKEGIRTKRGGKWQANTIKTILENPFYTGIYINNGIVYRDCHDSLISEYVFNKVNSPEASEEERKAQPEAS